MLYVHETHILDKIPQTGIFNDFLIFHRQKNLPISPIQRIIDGLRY